VTPTCQSDVGNIKTLLLKRAEDAFVDQSFIDKQWQSLGFTSKPDFNTAVAEYQGFVEIINQFGIEIVFAPFDKSTGLDSIYVRDSSIVCSKGIILCNMGKKARAFEPAACLPTFKLLELPVVGSITGEAKVEGGDIVWLNDRTLAIAEGYRTNSQGIEQLTELLGDCIDNLIVVPSPHWNGPDDVFHLMSTYSPIDTDLSLVYSPLLTVPFRNLLLEMGKKLIEVPHEEFQSMGCNVLTISPRQCVMLEGNPITRRKLEEAGVEVHAYKGTEISSKGCGGPTCLTRPLIRSKLN